MNRILKNSVLAPAVALLLLAAGCMENDISLKIRDVLSATMEETETPGVYICTFETGSDIPPCWGGRLDIGKTSWGMAWNPSSSPVVVLYFTVENYLPNNTDVSRGQLNTHDVRLNSIEVRYQWEAGREELTGDGSTLAPLLDLENSDATSVSFVAENIIDAGGADGSSPGVAMVSEAQVIPPAVGDYILSYMLGQTDAVLGKLTLGIFVRLVGVTTGGQRVESGEFFFPLRFCNGCAIDGGCALGQTPYNTDCAYTSL